MKELCGLGSGLVRGVVSGMLGSYYLPLLLMLFRQHYLGVRLSIVDGSDQLQYMLAEGEIDLAFIVVEDIPVGLSAAAILRMQMAAVLPLGHPWSWHDRVDIKAFLQQELVMFKPRYVHRRIIDQMALAAIPFLQPFWLNIHIAWRDECYLSVANRTFKEFIVKHAVV